MDTNGVTVQSFRFDVIDMYTELGVETQTLVILLAVMGWNAAFPSPQRSQLNISISYACWEPGYNMI
jgi:hypothetical protein